MIIFFSLSKEVFIFYGGQKRLFCAPFIHNGATLERKIVGYICVSRSPIRNKLKNFKNDKI